MKSPLRTRAPFVLERRGGGVLRTAHRGAPRLAPDNTLEAIAAAAAFPTTDFVEVDVHATRDGQVLLWHDEHLVTPEGAFAIAAHDLAELRALPVPDGTLATLPEAVETVRGRCGLMIDLKAPALEGVLTRDLRALGFGDVIVCGEYLPTLSAMKAALPALAVSLTPSAQQYQRLPEVLRAHADLDALTVYWRTVGPAMLQAAHAAGTLVLAWTVDHAHIARTLLEQGVDGLTSNDVELLAGLRGQDRAAQAHP